MKAGLGFRLRLQLPNPPAFSAVCLAQASSSRTRIQLAALRLLLRRWSQPATEKFVFIAYPPYNRQVAGKLPLFKHVFVGIQEAQPHLILTHTHFSLHHREYQCLFSANDFLRQTVCEWAACVCAWARCLSGSADDSVWCKSWQTFLSDGISGAVLLKRYWPPRSHGHTVHFRPWSQSG